MYSNMIRGTLIVCIHTIKVPLIILEYIQSRPLSSCLNTYNQDPSHHVRIHTIKVDERDLDCMYSNMMRGTLLVCILT
jgi:hypothetical protein